MQAKRRRTNTPNVHKRKEKAKKTKEKDPSSSWCILFPSVIWTMASCDYSLSCLMCSMFCLSHTYVLCCFFVVQCLFVRLFVLSLHPSYRWNNVRPHDMCMYGACDKRLVSVVFEETRCVQMCLAMGVLFLKKKERTQFKRPKSL